MSGEPPPNARTALVADDDALFRAQYGDVMREKGFHVVEATDGAEAVAATLMNLDTLAVVLLDLTMPNVDGFDVLHEIRAPTRERKVAIVVITGAAAEQAQAALAMGADQAVMKGATPEEVGALVDMAIETAAM